MAITAISTPLPDPRAHRAFVDEDGRLTPYGSEFLNSLRIFVNGMNRIIPCNASTTSNLITLTPLDSTPLLQGYIEYEAFSFTADATTSAPVTATVVPKIGTLATVKVYKTDGAAQADTGDIVANSVYLLLYAAHLDSSAGGLVLK